MLLRLPPNQLLHRISLLPLQQPPRSPLVHLRRLCLRIQQLFRQVFIRHALLRHRLRPQTRRLLRHPPLSSLQQVFPTLFVLISHRTQYYEIDIKSSKSCRIGFIRFFIFFNVTVFFKKNTDLCAFCFRSIDEGKDANECIASVASLIGSFAWPFYFTSGSILLSLSIFSLVIHSSLSLLGFKV